MNCLLQVASQKILFLSKSNFNLPTAHPLELTKDTIPIWTGFPASFTAKGPPLSVIQSILINDINFVGWLNQERDLIN